MDQRDQFPMSSCLSMQQTTKLGFDSGNRRIEIPSNVQAENELDPVITWIDIDISHKLFSNTQDSSKVRLMTANMSLR